MFSMSKTTSDISIMSKYYLHLINRDITISFAIALLQKIHYFRYICTNKSFKADI